jgi:hypothetical protein
MNVGLNVSVTGLAVVVCFPEGVKKRKRQKNE